ncbi:MAG: dihydrofolate reductase [Bacteroidota bacterium]
MLKSIIVAKAQNNAIGKDNQLLWHLPQDMKHFKQTTMGHHMIMGRKTFESIGRPLPGRELIVVTRNPDYHAPGCKTVGNIEEALAWAEQAGEPEVLIAGGEEIYRATLPLTDKIYLTEVKTVLEGDTFFPTLDQNKWREMQRTAHPADENHAYAYDFVELINVSVPDFIDKNITAS